MRSRIPYAALLLLSAAAYPQDAEPPAAGVPRYAVEVVVFEYAEDVAIGSERFVPDPPPELPGDAGAAEVVPEFGDRTLVDRPPGVPGDVAAGVATEAEPLFDTELALTPREELTLGGTLERLELIDAYRPLMHFGWTQRALPREESEPVTLSRLAPPPEGLDGSFILYRSRFLHLVVDISLRADAAPAHAEAPRYDFGDAPPDGTVAGTQVYFRIQEDRIFKDGEIRYFDHPKFGLLVKVSLIEEADEGDPAGVFAP